MGARPTFVAVANRENALKFMRRSGSATLRRAHAALDAIDAAVARGCGSGGASTTRYLGECHKTHETTTLGYANATGTKIALEYEGDVRAEDAVETFDAIAEAYARAASGAFADVGERIDSDALRRAVDALLAS
ncbi:hypothetical protein BE221DRAFT_80036 [Ostreococcus tauri]|uniref:Uncharacterized protein n=1 Tax=Ostreococcus tauri TaxID=70448 RepID=A0A1Y5I4H9_OSTTA|nr:hypothetical protein BE221DRAFT_80036 [Ostreococcus tauri]